MGAKTDVKIDIAAPPEKVFEWLTDREKVARWAGGDPNYLPDDGSELHVGYTAKGTRPAPGGARQLQYQVTAYEPPTLFSSRGQYAGGEEVETYTLSATASGTRLELSSDADYAQAAGFSEGQKAQLRKQGLLARFLIRGEMKRMEHRIESGALDENPQVKAGMESMAAAALARLKQLVENETSGRA